MVSWRGLLVSAAVVAGLSASAWPAQAQVFGTFTWQLQPYCNRVSLTLTAMPWGFALAGTDDQCGAATRGAVTGAALFNPDGTVGAHFSIVTADATVAQVATRLDPGTGQGTWTDSRGQGGAFVLGSFTPGLPRRPGAGVAMSPLTLAENPRDVVDPCAQGPIRPTLTLCGSSTTGYWSDGGFGLLGVEIWRDAEGRVHIRGSVRRSQGPPGSIIFMLPEELRPRRTLALPVITGRNAGAHTSGVALLFIRGKDLPDLGGFVSPLSWSDDAHTVVHFGELVFTVDR